MIIDDISYTAACTAQATAITNRGLAEIAISTAIALWQRSAKNDIADLADEIASANLALAEEVQAHAAGFYAEEADFVNDAFGEVKQTEAYYPNAVGWAVIAHNAIDLGRSAWIKDVQARCANPSTCEDARWSRHSTASIVDIKNASLRHTEWSTQAINDRRYARQLAAIGLGKGKLDSSVSLRKVAGTVGANASDILAGTINSGLTAIGFYPTRSEKTMWGYNTSPTSTVDNIFSRTGSALSNMAKEYLPQEQPPIQVTVPSREKTLNE